MVSILSIDGGGIRGIIPATFLVELERRTGKPIASLFDLIAGTSTGGLLATTLTAPDSAGRPKYTAEQTLAAYFDQGGAIFHQSALRAAATLGGLLRPRYSPRALEQTLAAYLGDIRLHATLTDILVTAYDMGSATPWFFKTTFAKQNRDLLGDPLLAEVARATSAAPTYFPPLALEGHCLTDGGVFACNPALCAYAEARNRYPLEKEFLLVSLGTGDQDHERPCNQVKDWGILGWAVPISAVMLNASSATVDYQMRALLGKERYARFQVRLEASQAAMDDASEANMKSLKALAWRAVAEHDEDLDRLARALLRQGAKPLEQSPGNQRAVFVSSRL